MQGVRTACPAIADLIAIGCGTPTVVAQMGTYNEELMNAGLLLDLAALHWSAEGVRVKFSGGTRTVVDGPFAEPKATVAGYWILQVRSMDEAVEWVRRLPFEACGEPEAEGEIEIRQLFELDDFGESPSVGGDVPA